MSDPQSARRAIEIHGAVDLSFRRRRGATSLGRLYYTDPMKVLFPAPARGDVPLAALVTTGGGMLGGDTYEVEITLAEGAEALVTQQAAEKIYRTTGPDCRVNVRLSLEKDAVLEWLPQETILFDRSRFRRQTRLDLAPGAKALAGEFLVFGRTASGESFEQGLLREEWQVHQAGQLAWMDALHLEGEMAPAFDHMAGFGGARALATAVYAGSDADDQLDQVRDFLAPSTEDLRCGATLVNGVLVCRWLGRDAAALRQAYGGFWQQFRHHILGRPDRLPRLWQV